MLGRLGGEEPPVRYEHPGGIAFADAVERAMRMLAGDGRAQSRRRAPALAALARAPTGRPPDAAATQYGVCAGIPFFVLAGLAARATKRSMRRDDAPGLVPVREHRVVIGAVDDVMLGVRRRSGSSRWSSTWIGSCEAVCSAVSTSRGPGTGGSFPSNRSNSSMYRPPFAAPRGPQASVAVRRAGQLPDLRRQVDRPSRALEQCSEAELERTGRQRERVRQDALALCLPRRPLQLGRMARVEQHRADDVRGRRSAACSARYPPSECPASDAGRSAETCPTQVDQVVDGPIEPAPAGRLSLLGRTPPGSTCPPGGALTSRRAIHSQCSASRPARSRARSAGAVAGPGAPVRELCAGAR